MLIVSTRSRQLTRAGAVAASLAVSVGVVGAPYASTAEPEGSSQPE
jgi:hypothetical protein